MVTRKEEMSFPSTRGGAALLLLLGASAVLGDTAANCDPFQCQPPGCRCSTTETPGGLSPSEIPHFVVLTFDDYVTNLEMPFYRELQEFKNPNGCGIKMTFYVWHLNTDYTLVNELYRNGHEIAVHTVTHDSDVANYWHVLSKEGWQTEIEQQKQMLEIYGKVPGSEIEGFRAPYLEVGGNEMYGALHDAGLKYDCSWPTTLYTPWFQMGGSPLGALWPYTLDYASTQEQSAGRKPTDSFPGLWAAPMTNLQDNTGNPCAMLDLCNSANGELDSSTAAVEELFQRNFEYHSGARTPFGIYLHYYWFNNDNDIHKNGLKNFLTYLESHPEAYVVSASQLIDWVQNPVPLSQLGSHPSFQCSGTLPNTDCANSVNCYYQQPLPISSPSIYLNICEGPCPPYYPYLNNVDGSQPYSLVKEEAN